MLSFACTGARPTGTPPARPWLDLRVREASGPRVHAVALRCQIRIEPRGRTYAAEEARLVDLFGEPARWGETLNPLQLATVGPHGVGLHRRDDRPAPVPCTYDLEIAATKYFHALDDGESRCCCCSPAPCSRAAPGGPVEQVPWTRGPVPAARRDLAGDDGRATTPARPGCGCAGRPSTRSPVHGPGRAAAARPGTDAGNLKAAAEARRGVRRRDPLRRGRPQSPTPCSTRATCSTPTGPRRTRTSCAGSSACSPGRPGAAATDRTPAAAGPSACWNPRRDAVGCGSGCGSCSPARVPLESGRDADGRAGRRRGAPPALRRGVERGASTPCWTWPSCSPAS